jgi:hypothetical protein
VALDGGRLVCVEVKTALGTVNERWRPGDRFRQKAIERQLAAGRSLRAAGLGDGGAPRLDLLEVWIGPPGSRPQVAHHKNVRPPPALRDDPR